MYGRPTPGWGVYVGSPSRWANPWVVARVGRKTAVENYREALLLGNLDFTVEDVQRELRGKDLYCWCSPFEECHADTLLMVAAGVCPKCEGSGDFAYIDDVGPCPACDGTGVIGDA